MSTLMIPHQFFTSILLAHKTLVWRVVSLWKEASLSLVASICCGLQLPSSLVISHGLMVAVVHDIRRTPSLGEAAGKHCKTPQGVGSGSLCHSAALWGYQLQLPWGSQKTLQSGKFHLSWEVQHPQRANHNSPPAALLQELLLFCRAVFSPDGPFALCLCLSTCPVSCWSFLQSVISHSLSNNETDLVLLTLDLLSMIPGSPRPFLY